ncbi:putative transposase [Yersinia similis]|uniref:Putative transposase n=1 Tax=Yersinia similis TaxID=367190 RepID=A0A0T9RLT0_9GAMM|nr:putative transposase [Yersinia similis]CNI70986.1 putative transposase [Yersinia similis]
MFTEADRIRAIELYFKYGRKLDPWCVSWGIPLKETSDAGSVYGKRVAVRLKAGCGRTLS